MAFKINRVSKFVAGAFPLWVLDILLKLLQLIDIKGLVPANINEDFDTTVKFQQGLGSSGLGKSPLEGAEGEHRRLVR